MIRRLSRLPGALGALGLAVPTVLLAWNLLTGLADPNRIPLEFGPHLEGVMVPPVVVLTVSNVLRGRFQAAAALAIGPLVPLQRAAVRFENQLTTSLMGQPGPPFLVLTRGRTLVELAYLEEYCHRDVASFRAKAAAWLPKLQTMQRLVEQRGQTFLYVITPSKVAMDPALVPQSAPCPATAADRNGLMPLWRGMLDGAGVHYVDTTAVVRAAKADYPLPMYPRGGTHWTMLGAALATQPIAAALDRLRRDDAFVPFTFTWTPTNDPAYPDNDLALLTNLARPELHYPVPLVHIQYAAPAAPCRPVFVAIVGGSFMHQVAQILASAPCRPRVEEWEYWRASHLTWPNPGELYVPTKLNAVERRVGLTTADVVIYEENEQNMARSKHGPAFLNFLRVEAQ